MWQVIQDPVLGELVYDDDEYAWCGSANLTTLGGPIPLWVSPIDGPEDINPPSEAQRWAFKRLLENEGAIMTLVAQALFEYESGVWARANKDARPPKLPPRATLPKQAGPSEIWAILRDPRVMVEDQDPAHPTIALSWTCPWFPEHRLEATVEEHFTKVHVGEWH